MDFALVLVSGLYLAVIPMVWCYLWEGGRPRHCFWGTYLIAAVGSVLWLPLFLLVWGAYVLTTPREVRKASRRQRRQERRVDEIEATLKMGVSDG